MTVPINVVDATEDHSIRFRFRFRQYYLEDMGRVRVRKVCELEDRGVSQDGRTTPSRLVGQVERLVRRAELARGEVAERVTERDADLVRCDEGRLASGHGAVG